MCEFTLWQSVYTSLVSFCRFSAMECKICEAVSQNWTLKWETIQFQNVQPYLLTPTATTLLKTDSTFEHISCLSQLYVNNCLKLLETVRQFSSAHSWRHTPSYLLRTRQRDFQVTRKTQLASSTDNGVTHSRSYVCRTHSQGLHICLFHRQC